MNMYANCLTTKKSGTIMRAQKREGQCSGGLLAGGVIVGGNV